jgi:hypothetical protein
VRPKENARREPGGFPESVQQVTNSVPQFKPDAQAGKWIAVALCCAGTRGLSVTQTDFSRHPEWTAA